MKSLKLALIYMLFLWLVPFIVSFLLFPIKDNNAVFYKSLMSLILLSTVVVCFYLYFRKLQNNFKREAIFISLLWLGFSLAMDLIIFVGGPIEMGPGEYVGEIGITYLFIPLLIIPSALLLAKATTTKQKPVEESEQEKLPESLQEVIDK